MNHSEVIYVKAQLKMHTTQEGGRSTGFLSGLRPNHVFEYDDNGFLRTYIGDIQFDGQELIMPGESKEILVRFIDDPSLHKYLQVGRTWWIHEGAKQTGEAQILKIL
ncbi:hypothetical protein [Mangrovimonas sp. ST2L15]|uniref:hypothetical protein n=1 Tax=Mangrovimonas sp. ST2L15 TaxID=1645916 RepID=UPI0006B588CC|nr:hypothetical protein [Mangrovimonas sp. ST2L15]